MNASPALLDHQQALQAWLLHGDAAIGPRIDATPVRGETVHDRLRIYRDAYALRLIEVLGQDFPVLKALLGEARFDTLARAYLQAHPSTQPSVRHFGARFAGWLAQGHDLDAAAVELARFEWTQGEVFDAADDHAVSLADMAVVPPQHWPRLRFMLASHLRWLTLSSHAPAQVTAHAAGDNVPEMRAATPATWLLWREAFAVHWRRLDADEADALRSVRTGQCFGDLCTQLAHAHGPEAPLRAAGLLKRWIHDGLVAALRVVPADHAH